MFYGKKRYEHKACVYSALIFLQSLWLYYSKAICLKAILSS